MKSAIKLSFPNMIMAILMIVMATPCCFSQTALNGKVFDPEGNPVAGIIIRLMKDGKIKSYGNSKRDGSFSLKTDSTAFPGILTFKSNKYSAHEIEITGTSDSVFATLYPEQYTLEELVVRVPRVRTKGDTITYDVASYTNASDRSIEDVIKKLPGVEVSDNGTIFYDGEPINNFYIEGLNLMGSNYMVASQNINPKDISTVSVYERHQPKKALKNVVDSKKAALNLKLKKSSMLKPVGYLKGAAGYGDDTLWGGQIYTMFISPSNQTIISANGNNTGSDYLGDRTTGHKANTIFSRKPFGTPSLPSNRYTENKSAYFTANSLFKIKEDLTLKANTSYGLDHDGFDMWTSTEYPASDLANPSFIETIDNGLRKHSVAASMKVEKNADRLYLMDQLSFTGTFNDNDYDIFNTGGVRQSVHNDHYALSNDLSSVIKIGRYNTLQFTSKTSFQNTPLNRMVVYDRSKSLQTILQNISGKSFHNEETTGYNYSINRINSIGSDLDSVIDHDRFNSEAIVSDVINSANNLTGHNIRTKLSPFYKYNVSGKISWKISFPIEWQVLKYTNFITNDINRVNKLFVNINSSFYYRLNAISDINIEASWNHDTGDITNFIDNPIYTTYRNIQTLGSGSLVKTLAKHIRGNYSLRDVLNGFYLRGSLSYTRRKSNSLSAFDVSEDGTSSAQLNLNSHSNSTNFIATVIKHVNPIHSRFSINFSGIWMTHENMRGNTFIKVKNDTYMVSCDASTEQFNDRLNVSLNLSCSLNRQRFGNLIPANNLDELSGVFKISYSPIKKLELYANANYNRSELADDNYKTNIFVDAGARLKILKFEIELSGKNLTNMKKYEYTLYRTLDIQTFSYNLRPIEGIFSIRYNF